MSVISKIGRPIINTAKNAKHAIQYSGKAANRLQATRTDLGTFGKTRVRLESVRRNNPEFFYPAVGFCTGIPGGTSLGILFHFAKKYIGKLF